MTHEETAAVILAQLKSMDLGDRVIDRVQYNAERDCYEATGTGPKGPIGLAVRLPSDASEEMAKAAGGMRLGYAFQRCACKPAQAEVQQP